MLDTNAPARRGTTLDELLAATAWLTPGELADLLAIDGLTDTAGPVGLWIVGELAARTSSVLP